MRILDEEVNLKENFGFSLMRYRVRWLVLLITAVFDYFSTLCFVQKYGVASEGNVLVSWLIRNLGLVTGVLFAKILQISVVAVFASLHKRLGNLFLFIIILFNFWAIVVNLY